MPIVHRQVIAFVAGSQSQTESCRAKLLWAAVNAAQMKLLVRRMRTKANPEACRVLDALANNLQAAVRNLQELAVLQ